MKGGRDINGMNDGMNHAVGCCLARVISVLSAAVGDQKSAANKSLRVCLVCAMSCVRAVGEVRPWRSLLAWSHLAR